MPGLDPDIGGSRHGLRGSNSILENGALAARLSRIGCGSVQPAS